MARIKKPRHFRKPGRGLSVRVEKIRETEILSDYTSELIPESPVPDSYDTVDSDVEDHVAPFIAAMSEIQPLEPLNLKTKTGALQALAVIDKALENIDTRRRMALALKTILEEKKALLDNNH